MTDNTAVSERTRSNLAYILVIGALIMLAYILFKWGDQKEILTLIIGLIGGTILGLPLGVYFAGGMSKKADSSTPVTGDNTTVVNNPATATS